MIYLIILEHVLTTAEEARGGAHTLIHLRAGSIAGETDDNGVARVQRTLTADQKPPAPGYSCLSPYSLPWSFIEEGLYHLRLDNPLKTALGRSTHYDRERVRRRSGRNDQTPVTGE